MNFRSYKYIYILAGVNVLLIGIWCLLFNSVSSLRAEYHAVSLPLAEESGKESYVTRVSRQLRESESDRASLKSLVVDKGNEAVFLEKIEELGSVSGTMLKISGFEERGGALRLAVKSSGTFANVLYFMNLLEALPLSVSIERGTLAEFRDENNRIG